MSETQPSSITLAYDQIQQIYSENFLTKVLKASQKRNYLWHVAMPKSGSTWLSEILAELFKIRGGTTSRLIPDHAQRPQEIDPRLFVNPQGQDVFFYQQHCVYSRYTEHLVNLTGTKIIFQYRNLPDVMVSLRDHFELALSGKYDMPSRNGYPKGMWGLEQEKIFDYILDVELPWYCKFLDGWLSSDLAQSDRFFAVRYEDLIDSPAEILRRLSTSLSMDFTEEEILQAIENSASNFTRKNKAVVGRGKSMLSEAQKEQIARVSGYFRTLDNLYKD